MIHRYKIISIIYGGSGKTHAKAFNKRITKIASDERYPISTTLIMENILTSELFNDVMDLFRTSEFCIAFLTANDIYNKDNLENSRLRQNVIFELGMALIQLGRERCIFQSGFDVQAKSFDMPTDMNSLEIKQFNIANMDEVFAFVVEKILTFSQKSIITGISTETIP